MVKPKSEETSEPRIVRGPIPRIHPDDVSLITDKAHPLYDKRVELPLSMALVDSIRESGTLQNVGLWKDGGVLWCVFGNQRTRACQYLLHEENVHQDLRFEIRKGTTADMLAWKMEENLARQEASPSWRAEMAQRLLNNGGTKERAMIASGCKSPEAFALLLKLNDLDDRLKLLVDTKELPATFAEKELAKFPRDKMSAEAQAKKTGQPVLTQYEVYEQLKADGKLSGEKAGEAVRNIRSGGKAADAEPIQRMTSRKVLMRWQSKLEKIGTPDSKLARNIIRRILGHERALHGLGEIFTAYDEAVEPAPRTSRKKDDAK